MLGWLLIVALAVTSLWPLCTAVEVEVIIQPGAVRTIGPEFLSLGLDSSIVRHGWCGIDWRKARILAGALSPAFLRFGGNDADRMRFDPDAPDHNDSDCIDKTTFTNNFTINRRDWKLLTSFAMAANLSLVFDLNALLRDPKTDTWDPTNARRLLGLASARGDELSFELGNEPNAWRHKYGHRVEPQQLVKLLAEFPRYAAARLVGPSTTSVAKPSAKSFFKAFMDAGGGRLVNASTFHHYYISGWTANESQFLDPANMDSLNEAITLATEYSNWLNKLGMSALGGLDVVVRQSIFKGDYSLLDPQTEPNPDYFLSLLFKRVVPAGVLQLSVEPASLASHVRLFAHCDDKRTVIYGMNLLAEENVTLTVRQLAGAKIAEYIYSPNGGKLTSRVAMINDQRMRFNGKSPPRIPRKKPIQTNPVIPARRIAVFVFGHSLC